MRTASAFLRSALAVVALLIASSSVQAAAPGKPVEFGAQRIDGNGYAVKLWWMANREGDAPTHFDIYMAASQTEDESLFDKIGSVDVKPDTPADNVYRYVVENLRPGTYTFFIRAVNADGESVRSIIRVVKIEDNTQPKIDIASTPPNAGYEGKEYKYFTKLMKNFDGGEVRWTLVHGPDGMTINAEGVVTWPEPKAGRYEIKIKVEVEHGGIVLADDQSWVIEVKEGNSQPDACVTIYGTVTSDAPNTVVMRGVVTAWRMERVTKDNGEVREEFRPIVKVEVQQGTYALKVPAGTYKLRIEGEGFYAEWFEDVHELADAKNIEVVCDEPRVEVNFAVEMIPEPVKHMVSGRVYDAETNEGIHNALVVFEQRKTDGANTDRGYGIKVETDAEGNYTVKLPEGKFYVGSANARGEKGTERGLYMMEWWQETHDATQATVIEVTGDIEGIDFSLDKRQVKDNVLAGKQVDDSTRNGVWGKVTAYLMLKDDDPNGEKRNVKVISVETNDDGGFSFTDLEPGDYRIFGVPGKRPYVPGWYRADDVAAHSWKDATVVTVTDDSKQDGIVIRFEQAKDGIGRGRIRGWVFDRRGGIVRKSDGVVQANDGIMGSLVVATDDAGSVIDYAMSENEGSYELLQLGLGTWNIQADRVGYDPTKESVTLDDQNLDVSLSIGLIKQVTSVEVPIDGVGTVYNLYPNPTNADAVLSFPSTQGSAQISLISAAGVVLATQSVDVATGQTTMTIETSSMPSGMVMVRVANGTETFALPLQIVR